MADELVQAVVPSEGQQQVDLYNRGSTMVLRGTYSPPAGTPWCVMGCVLNDAVTPGDVPTVLGNVEALAEITSIHNNFLFVAPAEIQINPDPPADPTHRLLLCTTGTAAGTQSLTGQAQTWQQRLYDAQDLSSQLGKKILVFAARLPTPLSDVTGLEAAVTGVTGITLANVQLIGQVPASVANAQLSLESRLRIDPIPEE